MNSRNQDTNDQIEHNTSSKSDDVLKEKLLDHNEGNDEKKIDNPNTQETLNDGTSKLYIILSIIMGLIILVTVLVYFKYDHLDSRAVRRLVSNMEIKKPLIDKRDYRVIRLANKIDITLISDAGTNKAAASLSVGVGSLEDDPQIPGLAHFTEHMMFLGSKTYPQPSTFEGYLSNYLGLSNAFTEQERTTYYFELAPAGYEKALEMFSKMFTEPLMEAGYMNKEIDAVNSEHLKNINNDDWREYQLMKSLADPERQFGFFATGNNSTLRNVGLDKLHEEVEKFVKRHYVPSNMKLVLLSTHSLDELETLAETYFSQLTTPDATPNATAKLNSTNESKNQSTKLVSQENIGQIIWYKRISQGNKLNFVFFLDEIKTKYKTQPLEYVCYLLKDSKNGSLLHDLKENSLASNLEPSIYSMDNLSMFFISISLTSTGLDNVNEVIMKTFNYLKVVQSQKIQFRIYEELRNISSSMFNYLEVSSDYGKTMAKIAINMFNFKDDIQNLLYGDFIFSDYDEGCIKTYIDQMTVENALIMIGSNEVMTNGNNVTEFAESGKGFLTTEKIEKWYGTLYNNNKVSGNAKEKMKTSEEYKGIFALRKTNQFITKYDRIIRCEDSLEACEREKNEIQPISAVNYTNVKIWYRMDRSFLIPKINCYFHIIPDVLRANSTTPTSYQDSIKDYYYFLIYYSYLKSAIETELSDATTAGNLFEITLDENGIVLFVNSYTDVTQTLVEHIFSLVFHPKITDGNIKHLKEMTFQFIENHRTQQPYEKALKYLNKIVKINVITYIDLENVMMQITQSNLPTATIVEKVSSIVKGLIINSLLYGNVSKSQVHQIETILQWLSDQKENPSGPRVEPNEQELCRLLHMNKNIPGSIIFRRKNDLHSEANHVILNFFQIGRRDNKVSLLSSIISILWDNMFYYQLRTMKQLGYVVFARKLMKDDFLTYYFLVQGNKKTPDQMNFDIDLVIKDLNEKTTHMTENELESYKKILIAEFEKFPANLRERSDLVWKEIFDCSYDFTRKEKILSTIPLIQKEEIVELFNKIFFTDVHKLSIQIFGGLNGVIRFNNESYSLNETVISQVTEDFNVLK